MAYTPPGRQQDNSILSQIMKYDKSVQPPQSYTNIDPKAPPFGRMEDWETLAKGLGKGIGIAGKKAFEYGKQKYGEYKGREEAANQEMAARLQRDATRERAVSGGGFGEVGRARPGYPAGSIAEAKNTLRRMEGWDELSPGEQDEATRVRSQSLWLQQLDPKEYRQRFPDAPTTLKVPKKISPDEAFEKKYSLKPGDSQRRKKFYEDFEKREELNRRRDLNFGPDVSAANAELARRQAKANLASFQGYDTKYGKALGPQELRRTGSSGWEGAPLRSIEFKEMMDDPKFYNKWKMKMRRFLDPLKKIPGYQSEYRTGGR